MGRFKGYDGLKEHVRTQARQFLDELGVTWMTWMTSDGLSPREIFALASKGTREDGGIIVLDDAHVERAIQRIVDQSIAHVKG